MAGRRELTTPETLMKLITYTVLIFAVPLLTYQLSQGYLLPALYDKYALKFLQEDSARAVFSGILAVVAVNLVLLAYVLSAVMEANPHGGNEKVTEPPREAKRD